MTPKQAIAAVAAMRDVHRAGPDPVRRKNSLSDSAKVPIFPERGPVAQPDRAAVS
jgi:hypothetical protein